MTDNMYEVVNNPPSEELIEWAEKVRDYLAGARPGCVRVLCSLIIQTDQPDNAEQPTPNEGERLADEGAHLLYELDHPRLQKGAKDLVAWCNKAAAQLRKQPDPDKLLAEFAHGTELHIYGNGTQRTTLIPRTKMIERAREYCVKNDIDFSWKNERYKADKSNTVGSRSR